MRILRVFRQAKLFMVRHMPVWWHRMYMKVYRATGMALWFPHVPMAIAVGLAGVLEMLPSLTHVRLSHSLSEVIQPLTGGVSYINFRGLPHFALGFVQFIIGIGLLWRSRLAWFGALVMILSGLALALFYPRSVADHFQETYLVVLLVLLLLWQGHFRRSSLTVGTLFAAASMALVMGYGVVGSYVLGAQFKPVIGSFTDALYFTVVTMSTVGYGDILPVSDEARFFVISLIALGLTVFATSLSAVLVPLINGRMRALLEPRRQQMQRVNHYILVGDTPLARNTYRELLTRNESVTLILPMGTNEAGFEEADVVVGDPSDIEVLRTAGAERAKAIIALTEDDSENAFVVLAAREVSKEAKTVAAVSNARNLARVRRVHPDMVLAPQVLGGELLAMALTGEPIEGEQVLNTLFNSSPSSTE